jgi:hypothetical protein
MCPLMRVFRGGCAHQADDAGPPLAVRQARLSTQLESFQPLLRPCARSAVSEALEASCLVGLCPGLEGHKKFVSHNNTCTVAAPHCCVMHTRYSWWSSVCVAKIPVSFCVLIFSLHMLSESHPLIPRNASRSVASCTVYSTCTLMGRLQVEVVSL